MGVGAKDEVFLEYEKRGLRKVKYTPWYPSHVIVTNPLLTEELKIKINNLLQNLYKLTNSELILSKIKRNTTALVTHEEQDYEGLKEILKQLSQENE